MRRRLYRSRDDRLLGGVAAGIAEYFDIDPTIVRLAWVVTVLWGGAGIFLYLIAWIIVPVEPGDNVYTAAAVDVTDGGHDAPRRPAREREQATIGWLLIGIGAVIVLFGTNFVRWLFHPTVMLAALFVVAGLFFLGKIDRPPRVR